MKRLLVVVPTRERPHKIAELIDSFDETVTSDETDLLICLDEDDEHNYPRLPGATYEVGKGRKRLNAWLNDATPRYANDYKYIGFMGDDHRPRTVGWDEALTDVLEPHRYGVSYGNDLLMGMNLATACIQTSTIIQKLGFFSPPNQIHLFLDNYWMALGIKTNLVYLDHIVIEHMHYINNKSAEDRLYLEVNAPEVGQHDKIQWEHYLQSGDFQRDMDKLV